jgi:hypothetical protein
LLTILLAMKPAINPNTSQPMIDMGNLLDPEALRSSLLGG